MKRLSKICAIAALLVIAFSATNVFATEDHKLTASFTEDFIEWQSLSEEEKSKVLMPRISTFNISDDEYVGKVSLYSKLKEKVLNGLFFKTSKSAMTSGIEYTRPNYNLNQVINFRVKHQGTTNECWAFSMTSVLETNLALTQNIKKEFSPRHMDYSSIRTFTDGISEDNLNREAGMGGLAEIAVGYLSSGKGAVLENQMPFQDNSNKISKSELNKPVDTILNESITFPPIHKEYDANGNFKYTNGGNDATKKIYTDAEVKALREAIKKHITTYGAITAVTAGNQSQFYSIPTNMGKSKAYFCNDSSIARDHAVTIVGWDDEYSRDNFTGAAKPKNNGAYICLNSYGTANFDNGYLYISYEDCLIESYLYGIKSAGSVDYDKLYQYNPTGSNTSVGVSDVNKGYIAEVFSRDVSKKETLNYVGIDLPERMALKIYVNPTGNNPTLTACTLVATTEVLSAGYHRIPIKETQLTGSNFTIVVEETSPDNRFEFAIEIAVKDSIYSTILGNPGKCLYSFNGYTWKNLSAEQIPGFDMSTADTTIKAFTKVTTIPEPGEQPGEKPQDPPEDPDEPEVPPADPGEEPEEKLTLTTNTYGINNYIIYKIPHSTTIKTFKDKITTNSKTIEFYDDADKIINSENTVVKTGTKMKLSNGSTYTLIVRGDTNCDGEITLVDLSKLVAHYGDENHYGLSGNAKKAGDMNYDTKITLVDLSQMVELIGHL